MDVQFPNVRQYLITALRDLSDQEYQQKVWIGGEPDRADGLPDNFDYVRTTLWDDGPNYRDLQDSVGTVLRDEEEFRLMNNVLDALDVLFERHGRKRPDRDYVSTPEWGQVVQAAKAAWDKMTENDKAATTGEVEK